MEYIELILENFEPKTQKRVILSKATLAKKCNVDIQNQLFQDELYFLVKKGVLHRTKSKKLCLNKNLNIFLGTCKKNNSKLICSNTNDKISLIKEVEIPNNFKKDAMAMDLVLVNIFDTKNNKGQILFIINRGVKKVTGTFIKEKSNNFAFVIPDVSEIDDIYINAQNCLNAKNFDKVEVKLLSYPNNKRKAEGEIIKILGFKVPLDMDYLSIANEYGFQKKFKAKTIKQVEAISSDIDKSVLSKRLNLTDTCIFTVDCEESKDLDDAISIEKLDNGFYKLGVHIADVAHYVKEDSPLDKEALERGTSVYMIDKVLPMLPKKLSNNLCSLNPNETKLTLSVFMIINKTGDVIDYEIKESYIESKAKLVYNNVSNFLENQEDLIINDATPEIVSSIKNSLLTANELCTILNKKRYNRGCLDFNFNEPKIKLNSNDYPVEININERRIANKLIEEFMIITNEVIAEHFFKLEIPFIYRVHEKPKTEKLEQVFKLMSELDYEIPLDESNHSLQKIIDCTKDTPVQATINLLLLQAMQQAKYYHFEIGHFGLASSYYSHFTSPIRRYPDLMIHRIIKLTLNNKLNNVLLSKYKKRVEEYAKISSKKERQAQKAEIEYEDIKKAEFMQDKIGQSFEGMIISLNKDSCKVMLPNTVTGLIDLRDFNYKINQEGVSLISDDGSEIKIGTTLNLKLMDVSVLDKFILFEIE